METYKIERHAGRGDTSCKLKGESHMAMERMQCTLTCHTVMLCLRVFWAGGQNFEGNKIHPSKRVKGKYADGAQWHPRRQVSQSQVPDGWKNGSMRVCRWWGFSGDRSPFFPQTAGWDSLPGAAPLKISWQKLEKWKYEHWKENLSEDASKIWWHPFWPPTGAQTGGGHSSELFHGWSAWSS